MPIAFTDLRTDSASNQNRDFIALSSLFDQQQTNAQTREIRSQLLPGQLAQQAIELETAQAELALLPERFRAEQARLNLDTLYKQEQLKASNLLNQKRTFDIQTEVRTEQARAATISNLVNGVDDPTIFAFDPLQDGVPTPGSQAPSSPLQGSGISAQVTRFGFTGDPNGDPNSLNAIGNRDNRLQQGSSVALKASTAERLGLLNDEGKPAGQVEVEFPDGSVRTLNVDDTIPETSGDNDRIDFFDPDGEAIDIDGSEVTIRAAGATGSPSEDGPSAGLLASDDTDGLLASDDTDGLLASDDTLPPPPTFDQGTSTGATTVPAPGAIPGARPGARPAQPAQRPAQPGLPQTRLPQPTVPLPRVSDHFNDVRIALFDSDILANEPIARRQVQAKFNAMVASNPANLQFHNLQTAQPFVDNVPDPEIRRQVAEQVSQRNSPFQTTEQAQAAVTEAAKFFTEERQNTRTQQGIFSPAEEAQARQVNPGRPPNLARTIDDIVLNARNTGAVSEAQRDTLAADVRGRVLEGRPDAARQLIRNAGLGKSATERITFQADVKTAASVRDLQETMTELYFDGDLEEAAVQSIVNSGQTIDGSPITEAQARQIFQAQRAQGNLSFSQGTTEQQEALAEATSLIDALPTSAFEDGEIRPQFSKIYTDAVAQQAEALTGIRRNVLQNGTNLGIPLPFSQESVPVFIGGQQDAGRGGRLSAELVAKAGRFNAAYIKSISGAASTDAEHKRLSALSPTLGNSAALNFTLLQTIQDELENAELGRIRPLTGDSQEAIDFLRDPAFNFEQLPEFEIGGETRPVPLTTPAVISEVGQPVVESLIEGLEGPGGTAEAVLNFLDRGSTLGLTERGLGQMLRDFLRSREEQEQ